MWIIQRTLAADIARFELAKTFEIVDEDGDRLCWCDSREDGVAELTKLAEQAQQDHNELRAKLGEAQRWLGDLRRSIRMDGRREKVETFVGNCESR